MNLLTIISFPHYKDDVKKEIVRNLQKRAQILPKNLTANAKFDREGFERFRAKFGGTRKKGGE